MTNFIGDSENSANSGKGEPEPFTIPTLEVNGITKDYGTKSGQVNVLTPTSLSIELSELVTIVGPSGCGKSTLLHIVGGLIEPSSGEVFLDGRQVHGPGADRGMVFQGYSLFPWLTVRQNVQFGPKIRGKKRKEREEVANHFLDAVGLHGFRDHYPKALSGGMRQRVAIARALANSPRILLMDEPFGALDAQTRVIMQELLLEIRSKEQMTTLFITHDIDEAVFLSDRILVMSARPGKIKAEIAVPFGKERPDTIRNTPEFFELRNEVYTLLHAEGKAVIDAELASGSKK